MADASRPRRAVVTGAAGFIGSVLCEELRRRGYEVTGIDRTPGPGITQADVAEPEGAWRELLTGADVVIHAAAQVGDRGTKKEFQHNTVETTRTVLQACTEAGVGRVVHLSATAVHGTDEVKDADREVFFFTSAQQGKGLDRPERGLSETAPPQPTGNPYTDASIAAEQLATAYAQRGLPLVVARLSEVYGPHSLHWTIRPVELIRRHLMWVPPEAGVLSPLYIDDAIDGIIALAEHPEAPGEIFQISGNEVVSVFHFASAYADAMDIRLHRTLPGAFKRLAVAEPIAAAVAKGLGFELPVLPAAFEHLTHASAYSNAKMDRVLGWRPKVTLNTGIPRTLDWLRQNGYLGNATVEGNTPRAGASATP